MRLHPQQQGRWKSMWWIRNNGHKKLAKLIDWLQMAIVSSLFLLLSFVDFFLITQLQIIVAGQIDEPSSDHTIGQ